MKIYNSMHELVGNTPLIKLNNIEKFNNINIYAKLELFNPTGSVKDRIGKALIDSVIISGKLKSSGTIISATAGNTGLSLAFWALNSGYKVILVVPTKFSVEKQTLIKALGAQIVNTPRELGMLGANQKAEELHSQIKNSVVINQFTDQENPNAHTKTTGKEIYNALKGNIDYFVCGAGSGGTFSGVMKYLKYKNPNILGVLADPVGSTLGGGTCGDYNIEGIGNDFVPNTMNMNFVDKVIKVTDTDALHYTKLLALKEGIFAGTSSGANLSATIKLAKQLNPNKEINIVTLLPDRGDRYFSKNIYD